MGAVTVAAPLVPPEVDLRGFDWFPLFRRRLFASRFHRLASPAEWRAGVILWIKSWDETPAGSLPNDDLELAALAEVPRDLREWKKIKKWAMHGWELADDGRLYHQTVAEMTLEAWGRKEANRQRTAAATAARRDKRYDQRNVHHQTLPDLSISNNYLDSSTARAGGAQAREGGLAEAPWAARCNSWAKGRRWNPIDGPAPDEPGCLAPREIVEEALRKRSANGHAR